jgi:hypothetical protein
MPSITFQLSPNTRQWTELGINRASVEDLVVRCARVVDLPLSALSEFVVADEANYGRAVHRLEIAAGNSDPGRITNNALFQGVAKTIALGPGSNGSSSVAMRAEVVALALMYNRDGTQSFDQPAVLTAAHAFYVVAHEFGHCRDNLVRPQTPSFSLRSSDPFSIQRVADYFVPIVLSECFACVHAGPATTTSVYNSEVEEWLGSVRSLRADIAREWHAYQANPRTIGRLAFAAGQNFWAMLVQHAKLVGTSLGNPSVLRSEHATAQLVDARLTSSLLHASAILKEAWMQYPVVAGSVHDRLRTTWRDLAVSHGYRFDTTPEGDGLWLDDRSLPNEHW